MRPRNDTASTMSAPATVGEAVALGGEPATRFLAGGTNLVDLMKENVERPARAGRHQPAAARRDRETLPDGGLRLGALATNADTAYHPRVARDYPLLVLGDPCRRQPAVAQRRHQRRQSEPAHALPTISTTPRRPATSASPARAAARSAASTAFTPSSAPSEACIATHPSDMCVALAALDAIVHVTGPAGERTIAFADYHRLPGDEPQRDNTLARWRARHRDRPAGGAFSRPLHLSEAARPAVLRLRAGLGRRGALASTAAGSPTRASRSAASPTSRGAVATPKRC